MTEPMTAERLAELRAQTLDGYAVLGSTLAEAVDEIDRRAEERAVMLVDFEAVVEERNALRAWQVHTVERVRDTTDSRHTAALIAERIPDMDFGKLIDALKEQRDEARDRLARIPEERDKVLNEMSKTALKVALRTT